MRTKPAVVAKTNNKGDTKVNKISFEMAMERAVEQTEKDYRNSDEKCMFRYDDTLNEYFVKYFLESKTTRQKKKFFEEVATEAFIVKILAYYLEMSGCLYHVTEGVGLLIEGFDTIFDSIYNRDSMDSPKETVIKEAIIRLNKHLSKFGIVEYGSNGNIPVNLVDTIIKEFGIKKLEEVSYKAVYEAQDILLENGITVMDVSFDLLGHCGTGFLSAGFESEEEIRDAIWEDKFQVDYI